MSIQSSGESHIQTRTPQTLPCWIQEHILKNFDQLLYKNRQPHANSSQYLHLNSLNALTSKLAFSSQPRRTIFPLEHSQKNYLSSIDPCGFKKPYLAVLYARPARASHSLYCDGKVDSRSVCVCGSLNAHARRASQIEEGHSVRYGRSSGKERGRRMP